MEKLSLLELERRIHLLSVSEFKALEHDDRMEKWLEENGWSIKDWIESRRTKGHKRYVRR